MNDFEKLLCGVLDRTDTFLDASYTGRACYARLSNDLRIKAEFIYTSVKDHYNALKLTAISSRSGILDSIYACRNLVCKSKLPGQLHIRGPHKVLV